MRYLNTLTASMLLSLASHAQIMHYDVKPVRVLSGNNSPSKVDSVDFHPAHPLGTMHHRDSSINIWHFEAPPPSSKNIGVDCRGNNIEVLYLPTSPAPSQAAAIDSGVMINASAGTWTRPNYIRLAIQNAADNWDNASNKFLGVRFKRNGKWHYAWVKMSIDALPTKCEFKGYAYEQTAEKGIVAGARGKSMDPTGITESEDRPTPAVSAYNGTLLFHNLQKSYNVTLINMQGQIVQQFNVSTTNNMIQATNYIPGLYIAVLQSRDEELILKVQL